MIRSKRLIFLSHCLINTNSKVWGYATYGDLLKPLLKLLTDKDTGIVQLPCPEQTYLGMSRSGRSKEEYDTPAYRKHCESILKTVISSIKDYIDNGYTITGIIGIKGSPSCGVLNTYSNIDGGGIKKDRGVFIDVLKELMAKQKINIKFIEMDEANVEIGLAQVEKLLKK